MNFCFIFRQWRRYGFSTGYEPYRKWRKYISRSCFLCSKGNIFCLFFAAFYTSIYVFILGCSFFEKTSINKALLPNVSQPPIISYFVLMQATRSSFHIANYKKKTLLLLRDTISRNFFFHFQLNAHFMKKIPKGAEASNILVGELNVLDKPLSAFIRLNEAVVLGDLTEVPVPTRFIFILLGPAVSYLLPSFKKKKTLNRILLGKIKWIILKVCSY